MKKKPLSIQAVLTKHQDELFALMNDRSQFKALQQKVNELLADKSLTGNESVEEAKCHFLARTNKYNSYLSCLCAYLTGIAVS